MRTPVCTGVNKPENTMDTLDAIKYLTIAVGQMNDAMLARLIGEDIDEETLLTVYSLICVNESITVADEQFSSMLNILTYFKHEKAVNKLKVFCINNEINFEIKSWANS